MPQLDTGPWLIILFMSWSTFLVFVPPKVLAHKFPYLPSLQSTVKPKHMNWFWPWS
uniref:ATP synthase complex subunit 8 n=1 Tax=Sphyraena japonica TaxID=392545 RepID=T2HTX1_SPHJA|nr:ATP synthase F0 subunit 8 [Sphyraena japonica]BAN83455.1 ATPase subunit 8 [Sphyraena japonica]